MNEHRYPNHPTHPQDPQHSSDRGSRQRNLHPTSAWLLVFIVVVTAAVCFFAMEIWLYAGRAAIVAPRASFLAPLIMAVFVGLQGWRVRSYQKGKRSLSGIEAGRIFLLAQAGSRAGGILAGSALGVIAAYAHTGPTSFLADQMFNLACAAAASLALIVTSCMAERWCMVNDGDGGTDSGLRAGAPA